MSTSPVPETAMVLAAGLGTRMRPLTNDRPKALVEVAGRALIDHVLDRLQAVGVRRAVVNVHYFADLLEAHLQRRTTGPEIIISDERAQLLETGGGLVKALPLLGAAPIFVCNIDSIWLWDNDTDPLRQLADQFDPARMDARLLVVAREHATGLEGQGDFYLDAADRLRRRAAGQSAPFAYTGVQVLTPALLAGYEIKPFSLNVAWDVALGGQRLFGTELHGRWMHVGDPDARDIAEEIYLASVPAPLARP